MVKEGVQSRIVTEGKTKNQRDTYIEGADT